MGSSGEEPNKSIDASVGGLVWVRRRNGVWWPGKILGPDELPEGCVPMPRSGTPVKLLGRDNVSFDWYNLEESKRVKAFHCGEYDDCIKKVKESVSQHPKKNAKNTRREDAILCALELERLGQHYQNLSVTPVSQNGEHEHANESPSACEETGEVDENLDGFEGVKRMRGLEDLGMGVASSVKKKRSQVARVELLKRKNRQRPLTKVMASATMVSVPIMSEMKENDSVVIDDNSDCNGVSYENGTLFDAPRHESDLKCQQKDDEISIVWEDDENGSTFRKLFDVPLVDEELHSEGFSTVISDASQLTCVDARPLSNQSGCIEALSLENEEQNGSDPTTSGTVNIDHIGHSVEKGSCEWRFKGKRNHRLRKLDNEAETYIDRESSVTAFTRNVDSKHHSRHRLLPYRQFRFTVNPKYDDSDFSLQHHITVSSLYDISIEVKTDYRPHHVPYISLMSKLTRRPIVGHPIAVEVLGDGFSVCYELDYKPRGRSSTKASSQSKSRRNVLLSKKTRKLSSLTGDRLSGDAMKKVTVEKMKGPSIACVPLKIVFSRINAALSSSVRMK